MKHSTGNYRMRRIPRRTKYLLVSLHSGNGSSLGGPRIADFEVRVAYFGKIAPRPSIDLLWPSNMDSY
jgi:hypothetical protein